MKHRALRPNGVCLLGGKPRARCDANASLAVKSAEIQRKLAGNPRIPSML